MDTARITSGKSVNSIKPADLPAPPQAAIQIVHACSDDGTDSKKLARLAASDMVITAEVLRVANSPFFGYGYGKKIQSIPRAVTVMGQRTLRNLVLCIAVRDAIKQDSIPGFDINTYWEDSLRRAVCARLLGRDVRLDHDECFTAGLLQDFGLLVMFFLQPDKAAMWPEMRRKNPMSRYQMEKRVFGNTHDKVGRMLAKEWGLPAELGEAISNHHGADGDAPDETHTRLCRLAYCVDWMAAVFTADDKSETLTRCRDAITRIFGLAPGVVEKHLDNVPSLVEEAATALGLGVGNQLKFADVMQEANLKLASENLSYQELTRQLEITLEERDRLAAELNREIALAQEIQKSLLPHQDTPGQYITGINLPARELSGDFYDFFTLPDGRMYFNLGDVSGKGINAALLMAKTSSLFRCLGKTVHSPGKLLQQINRELCETTTRGMFVAVTAGLYDPANGTVRLVNAGNPPALLIGRNGTHKAYKAESPPLGIDTDTAFPEYEFNLSDYGLYLFSDGITEGFIAKDETLGITGLLTLILEVGARPAQQRLAAIVDRIRRSPEPLRDDTTILLVEKPHDNGARTD